MISFDFLYKIYIKDKSIFEDFKLNKLDTAILPIMRYMAMDIHNLEIVKKIEPYWTFIKPIHILALLFLGIKRKRFFNKFEFIRLIKYIKPKEMSSEVLEQLRKYLKYTHRKFGAVRNILQKEVDKNSQQWEQALGLNNIKNRKKPKRKTKQLTLEEVI